MNFKHNGIILKLNWSKFNLFNLKLLNYRIIIEKNYRENKERVNNFGLKFKPIINQVKKDVGTNRKKLRILINAISIATLLFFATFLSLNYSINTIIDIEYWKTEYIYILLFSVGLGSFISWVLVSRLLGKEAKLYMVREQII
ncbi:MAG: hypothetical protein GF364_08975 [Candidatus Lokiarchaeota archaeon]|nr:hypothetical protein [Candidatus Lokiarchaeota archaeon]